MEDFDVIKDLWQTQKTTGLPNAEAVTSAIKKFLKRRKETSFLVIGSLIVAFIVMVWVMFIYHSKLWTTRFGEIMILVTVIYGVYLKTKATGKTKNDELLDNNSFLTNLKNEKLESCTGTPTQQLIAFSSLGVAYFFYIYETISASIISLIGGYLIIIIVLALMWFVYRPFMIKTKKKKIDLFLNKIDTIKNQNL